MDQLKGTEEIILSDGTVLPALIKCKKCSANISQNWTYCPHCAKRQNESLKKND